MPASDCSDGESEYMFLNNDLDTLDLEQLHAGFVRLRAAVRALRDYGERDPSWQRDLFAQLPETKHLRKSENTPGYEDTIENNAMRFQVQELRRKQQSEPR